MRLRSISKRSGLLSHKKGDVVSIVVIMVFLFMTALAFLFIHFIWARIEIKAEPLLKSKVTNVSNASEEIGHVFDQTTKMTNTLDYIIFIMFIGFFIGLIITSYLFQSHPVFYIIWLIVGTIFIIVAAVLSNVYEEIEAVPKLNETVTKFPMTNIMFDYLPIWITVMIFVSIAIIYAKTRTPGGYYGM